MSRNLEKCLISIKNALFYKITPRNLPKTYIFSKPIDNFEISTQGNKPTFWAVTGSRRSDFLKILASKYVSEPASGRSYPFMLREYSPKNIQFIDFRDSSGLDRCHMAARYESYSFKGKLEMSDDVNSVKNYISGANNYNNNNTAVNDTEFTQALLQKFDLSSLQDKWINTLSNGQMRRARIAKAVHTRPQILIIDEPFLGLDPRAVKLVAESLRKTAIDSNLTIVTGLRTADEIPPWITNVAVVDQIGLRAVDKKLFSNSSTDNIRAEESNGHELNSNLCSLREISPPDPGSTHIEFENASVIYKNVPVLQNFNWKVSKGSKWRILGDNGSGKTTILSLITAEHPQSWKSVLKINGIVRKPGSGVNYFDINNSIGISSPELHAVVPLRSKARQLVLNGLVRDVGNSNFKASVKNVPFTHYADTVLQRFDSELVKLMDMPFNELSVSSQKLILFLRAIVKEPEILVLDEAFSGMEGDLVKKCHYFIDQHLKDTTILTIGHVDWEVPPHEFVLKLTGGPNKSYKFYSLT